MNDWIPHARPPTRSRSWNKACSFILFTLVCGSAPLWTGAAAQQSHGSGSSHAKPTTAETAPASAAVPAAPKTMEGMDMGQKPDTTRSAPPAKSSSMGPMQGGTAPPDARDPDAFADGYDYGSMPGMEQADRIVVGKLLGDQLEFVHGSEGDGVAWDIHGSYGGDYQKLLIRTEGGVINGKADFTTGAEALWWRALTPFWGTVLGFRQEFGSSSHTQLAVGIEGLAPYWLQLEGTGYLAEDGGLSARLKGSYDIFLTNRLILTPEAETNLFSRSDAKRGVRAGVNNIELSARLRYEFTRAFAPYIGFDWEQTLARGKGTESDAKLVAGLRVLW